MSSEGDRVNSTDIEKRLTTLELELAPLKAGRTSVDKPHPIQVLEKIHGTFRNDDKAFREAMRLGRRWREGQRPQVRKAKRK
jgi:hypothetical protein